jgi:hypothetical protein
MTARQFAAQNNSAQPVTTTTETVVLTLPAVSTNGPGDTVSIQGIVDMTYGTGTTAVTVRVRRGTGITGTLVGTADPWNVTAGNTSEQTFAVEDTPGEVAGQAYVVTVQQTAATANGSVLHAEAEISLGP